MAHGRPPKRPSVDEAGTREALLAELARVRAERDQLRQVVSGWENEVARLLHTATNGSPEAPESRLGVVFSATRALVESRTIEEAARRVIAALAGAGGWDAGLLWLVDEAEDRLVLLEGWQAPDGTGGDFLGPSRRFTFRRGEGLPGRTWQLVEAAWVVNVVEAEHYPRASLAARSGLHASLAFPIRAGTRVLGVVELLSTEVREPVPAQVQMGAVLSSLIGQFIERERAQAAVFETNERLAAEGARHRAILESALDAIVTMDHLGRITAFNPAAEQLFGYRCDEVIGRDMGEVIVPVRLREAHRRGVERYLATEVPHVIGRRLEMAAMRRDGTEFPVELTITRIPVGGPPAFTGTMRDITDRLEAEAQRQELQALRRTDALKDQFLSILSHELRTPINAITGFGSILADGLAGELSDDQQAYLHKMLAGADVLLALVNDLLDMSRIQAGKFTLSPEPIALGPVLEEAAAGLAPLAEQKRQRLVLAIAPELPTLVADRQRLAQVIVNLVGNAIKFTPDGGAIRLSGALVREGEPGAPAALRVEVTDDGPGIAPEDQPKVFLRFTQLDMSATRPSGGTGLGLSISKALVEAHGGTIGVESRRGGGSTFWFTLPLEGPSPPPADDGHSEEAPDRV
jgi:PAS domain S-box-containing protein